MSGPQHLLLLTSDGSVRARACQQPRLNDDTLDAWWTTSAAVPKCAVCETVETEEFERRRTRLLRAYPDTP